MINRYEVYETNQMIAEENLDVRTITLGISLLDCIDADLDKLNENIYNKITTVTKPTTYAPNQSNRFADARRIPLMAKANVPIKSRI